MKALFWIIAIGAVAVGLVMAARYNTGYAVLVVPPYRIEISLNLLLLLLAAGFAGSYMALRLVSRAVRLPQRVREYRAALRSERADAALFEALNEYFSGRYARAEKAAARSLESGAHPIISAVIAARAAHSLRGYDRRDAYLSRAAAQAPGELAEAITRAELLLDQRRSREALEVLNALPEKHTAALRLELIARQMEKNWEHVLTLVAQLQKRGLYDPQQAARLRRYAQAEFLKRKALDSHALEEAWKKVPDAERKDPKIAAAAAQSFIALGGGSRAQQIIEQSLEGSWDSELIGLYSEVAAADALRQIERAEYWLKSQPRDAALLLTLGRLCARQGLWGKAQSYIDASISIEASYSAHLEAAALQERLGNADAARRHYRASLDLALAQLRQTTGGRRKTPL
jgi:HemY protein